MTSLCLCPVCSDIVNSILVDTVAFRLLLLLLHVYLSEDIGLQSVQIKNKYRMQREMEGKALDLLCSDL